MGPPGEFQAAGAGRRAAVSHRRQFPAQESSGRLGQRFPNSDARELGSGKVKQSQLDLVLGVRETGLSEVGL